MAEVSFNYTPPKVRYYAVTDGTKDKSGNLQIIGWIRRPFLGDPDPINGCVITELPDMTADQWNDPQRWYTSKALTPQGEIVEYELP